MVHTPNPLFHHHVSAKLLFWGYSTFSDTPKSYLEHISSIISQESQVYPTYSLYVPTIHTASRQAAASGVLPSGLAAAIWARLGAPGCPNPSAGPLRHPPGEFGIWYPVPYNFCWTHETNKYMFPKTTRRFNYVYIFFINVHPTTPLCNTAKRVTCPFFSNKLATGKSSTLELSNSFILFSTRCASSRFASPANQRVFGWLNVSSIRFWFRIWCLAGWLPYSYHILPCEISLLTFQLLSEILESCLCHCSSRCKDPPHSLGDASKTHSQGPLFLIETAKWCKQ